MDKDNTCSTLLEYLPTEIFLQIFAFFHLQELVTTFSGLNTNIDSIIRLVRTANHVVRFNDINAIHLLHSFPTQIARLTIVNVETIDLTPLINLRSLTLKYGTETQFASIRPENFPLLEILHIRGLHKSVNDNAEMNKLFQVILSNGFPHLRICTTSDIGGSMGSSETWTGSSSLRALNLNIATSADAEQLQSICPLLRRFTTYESTMGNPKTVPIIGAKRRIMRELEKLELLESENKFIIDVNPFAFFGKKEVPPRFNNTTIAPQPSSRENLITLQGRILPQSEPFCRASFLIEITLSNEYPFKIPSVTLLDPIYHPNACESDRHYRICGLNYDKIYHPKMSLTEIIEDILRIIDRDLDIAPLLNPECYREYKNDYPTFYKKALEHTLSYGRPRF